MKIIEQTPDKLILQTHIEWFIYPIVTFGALIIITLYLVYFYDINPDDFYSYYYKNWLPYVTFVVAIPFLVTAELTTYEFDKKVDKLIIKRKFVYNTRIEEFTLSDIENLHIDRVFLSNRAKIILNLKEFADVELRLSKPWFRDIDKLLKVIREFLNI